MRTVQKVLGWSLLVLLVLALLVLAMLTWVAQTDTGSRWALSAARNYLPSELQLGSFSGTLASPLVLHDVRFHSAGLELVIDRVEVVWQLFDLMDQQVTIEQLDVAGVRLALRPTDEPPSSQPLELPRLPVDVHLLQLRVRDVAVAPAPAADPLLITALDAAVRWNTEQLAVTNLRLQAPLADIDGSARLSFPSLLDTPLAIRAGPMDVAELSAAELQLELNYQLRVDGVAAVTGTLESTGPLADLHLQLAAGAPYGAQLTGSVFALLEQPRFDFSLSADTSSLHLISPEMPEIRIGLRGQAEGSAQTLEISALGESVAVAGSAAVGNVRGALEMIYSPGRLRIVEASLQEQQPQATGQQPAPASFQVSGLVELAGDGAVLDVATQWQDLRWPLGGPAQVRSSMGSLTVLGTPADYRALLQAQLSVPNQTDGSLDAQGSGTQSSFQLHSLNVATLEGTVSADGSASWSDGLNAALAWSIEDLNPAGLAPDWPGALDAQGSVTVRQPSPAAPLAIALQGVQLGGTLRDAPLAGVVELQYSQPALSISDARLALGANQVEISGGISSQRQYALDFELAFEALEVLLPGSAGSLSAKGRLSGPESAPVLQLDASAERLRHQQRRLNALTFSAEVGAQPDFANRVDLRMDQYNDPGVRIDRATLALTGPQTAHRVMLALEADIGSIDLAVAGATSNALLLAGPDGRYAFEWLQMDLTRPEQAPWRLDTAATQSRTGEVSLQAAHLDPTCLVSESSKVCAGGRWLGGSDGQVQLQLVNIALARFSDLLPPELALAGTIDGGGSIGVQGHQTHADLSFTTSPIAVHSTDATDTEAAAALVEFAAGRMQVTGAPGAPAVLQLSLPLDATRGSNQGGLSAQISLLRDTDVFDRSSLAGSVTARLTDLSDLAALIPEVSRLAGSLDTTISLGGTVAEPLATGHFRVRDAEAALVRPGVTVRNINLEAEAALRSSIATGDSIPVRLQGSMESGAGALKLDGELSYQSGALNGRVALLGERFLLLNNEQAELLVSPDLLLDFANESLSLRGVVTVPEADIALKSLPESAVVVSEDQILVGIDGASSAAPAYPYDAQVTLTLGDNVRFKGFGLDARFAGDLRIKQVSGEPGLGRGEIRITEGRYQAYGQDLSIETGRALWTNSPLDQPGLDLRAVRKPRPDILVGVRARGQLSQPDFSLFSEPALSESDQLSYLVLGRPLEDNSSAESSLLSQAALALGIRGGNFLSEQFGGRLGVDQIGIETEAGAGTTGAAFVVGKYLSPKLYVSYGLGLLDSVSTLKLEYLLSSKWRLVTESSTLDSGGDLIYAIERK